MALSMPKIQNNITIKIKNISILINIKTSHLLHGVVLPDVWFSFFFFLFFYFLALPRGDLEVIYPEVGDVSCIYVPKCHQYRRRISREWGSPRVRYPQAEKVSPWWHLWWGVGKG
uniref:Uncharacterized protein n=1 Tax=Calidris pygmaea TaxID=425635 RepID=A0A8C3PL17_9CHAR